MDVRKFQFYTFLIVFLMFFINIPVNAEDLDPTSTDQVCVAGGVYELTDIGEKLKDNIYLIDNKTQLEQGYILPNDYKEMMDYLEKRDELYTYIKSLEGKELIEPSKEDSDNLLQLNQLVREFANFKAKYEQTYNTYTLDIDIEDYSFKSQYLNKRCNRKTTQNGKYTWTSCPTQAMTTAGFSVAGVKDAILNNGLVWDKQAKQYYLEIEDKFDGKLVIRKLVGGTTNTNEYVFQSLNTSRDQIYYLRSGSKVKIYLGIAKKDTSSENITLEFYYYSAYGENRFGCNGSYLGKTLVSVPNYGDVDNTWYNSNICQDFRNGYEHIPTTSPNYKALMVSECYEKEVDIYDYNQITEDSIRKKIEQVSNMFQTTGTSVGSSINELKCGFIRDDANNIQTETKQYILSLEDEAENRIWEAMCTETIEVRYDPPKATQAGAGFTYNTTVTLKRQCTPYALKAVQKLQKCSYNVECWYGPANHTGEAGAGPNDEFDRCVSACDGGNYSQGCINKCYTMVYEEDSTLTYGRNFSYAFEERKNTLTQMRQFTSVNLTEEEKRLLKCEEREVTSPNTCYTKNKSWYYESEPNKYYKTELGNNIFDLAARSNRQANCDGSTSCTTLHGQTFTFLDGCNSETNPTLCYEVYTSQPRPYCSDNPDLDYKLGLNASNEEYQAIISRITSYEADDEFEISIDERIHNENAKTTTSKGTGKMLDSEKLHITGGIKTYEDGNKYKIVGSLLDTISGYVVPTYEVTKVYNIDLPAALVSVKDGTVSYVSSYDYKKIDNSKLKGGYKYYTSLHSPFVNDWHDWQTGYTPDDWNIHVTLKNLGTKQTQTDGYTWEEIKLDCFYGLINNYICTEDDPICPSGDDDNDDDQDGDGNLEDGIICPPDDICTGGLKYMFREVDLNDLFPDRRPRWNWTYEATVDEFGYYSNPEEVILDIETLGNSTYNSENLEYEIVLTRQNIRNIKKKNKELNNYLNYDFGSCSLFNGKKFCESRLLTNTNYVSSFTKVSGYGQNK